ncbi:hypothetical protein JCGZ_19830 [Jatropha curcas]|uniref:Uncharacterized protein n=1 Tax=Jatropha curcas TaxID=180498 RepID=A0A067JV22_JATCU|nr:hypothetical protein JCGZ_19830 [Jatropha curcas]
MTLYTTVGEEITVVGKRRDFLGNVISAMAAKRLMKHTWLSGYRPLSGYDYIWAIAAQSIHPVSYSSSYHFGFTITLWSHTVILTIQRNEQYGDRIVATEAERCKKFQEDRNDEIQMGVVASKFREFSALVEAAQEIERI